MESVQELAKFDLSESNTKEMISSNSLWAHAWRRLNSSKLVKFSLYVVAFYVLVAILVSVGVLGSTWNQEVGTSYAPPSLQHLFGTDILGRSVFQKVIVGTQVAIGIGLVTALVASIIGITLGAAAGYYGGRLDDFIVWLYTTMASIPYIMLIVAIAFVLGKGLLSLYLALGLTGWVHICRLVRGEVIKHKDRDYVQAAHSIGSSDFRKLFKHILPNVFHIIIINFSLQFQNAIKAEVILSFLGLGSQNLPSWGIMINEAKSELMRDVWWQLAGATFAMFFIVLALNVLGDALRDALDPKLKGKE